MAGLGTQPVMTLDPSTGEYMHMTPWKFMVTMIDEAAIFGIMVYAYNYTGMVRIFLPWNMREEAPWMQALRYGLYFASMTELRRWLEAWGLNTSASAYLDQLTRMFK